MMYRLGLLELLVKKGFLSYFPTTMVLHATLLLYIPLSAKYSQVGTKKIEPFQVSKYKRGQNRLRNSLKNVSYNHRMTSLNL